MRERYGDFPYASHPHTCVASLLLSSPTRVAYLLHLVNSHYHHNHPKSHSLLRVHSRCCTFCEFGWVYSEKYPSLSIMQNGFIALKILHTLPIHFSQPLIPGNVSSFYCLQTFALSRMSYSWSDSICSLFRWASFT